LDLQQKSGQLVKSHAAIEPIIGHLKSDHRAARNFLKGQLGDSINFMMAAAGFNFKKLMVKLKEQALWPYFEIQNISDNTFWYWRKRKLQILIQSTTLL
tara:strand:- start:275 stop:571 length:297 start_codon:yes stop_codon:yes gene_type:complete